MSELNVDLLNLETNEDVLLYSYDIWSCDNENESNYEYLCLTNKHFIRVTENAKFFGKDETIVDKIPLNTIKEAKQVDDEEYGDCLRLTYINGKSELYEMCSSPKKEHPKWVSAINDVINKEKKIETQHIPSLAEGTDNPRIETKSVYCAKCGTKQSDYAKFCQECGNALGNKSSDAQMNQTVSSESIQNPPTMSPFSNTSLRSELSQERKTVYACEIQKCPSCGETLNSFVAVCPACGFELTGKEVSLSLKNFIDEINECDKTILNTMNTNQTGWKSWSTGKKVGWVVLNIFTYCIPLVFYYLFPYIQQNISPKLSPDEQRKASVIANFPFPNDRESILEALLFAKSKVIFHSSNKSNKNAFYWVNLWTNKTEQLYKKAEVLFKGDRVANEVYTEVIGIKTQFIKKAKSKIAIGIALVILVTSFLGVKVFNSVVLPTLPKGIIKDYSETYEWPTEGLSVYLSQPEIQYGEIRDDDETRFSFDLYKVNKKQFEAYVKQCKNKGFTLYETKTDSVFYSYNSEQYKLSIMYHELEQNLSVLLEAPEKMTEIKWPTEGLAKKLPTPKTLIGRIWDDSSNSFGVYIANVSDDDYAAYIDECMKKGYKYEYSREEKFFSAENFWGYELTIRLQEFNTMSIYIENPSEN